MSTSQKSHPRKAPLTCQSSGKVPASLPASSGLPNRLSHPLWVPSPLSRVPLPQLLTLHSYCLRMDHTQAWRQRLRVGALGHVSPRAEDDVCPLSHARPGQARGSGPRGSTCHRSGGKPTRMYCLQSAHGLPGHRARPVPEPTAPEAGRGEAECAPDCELCQEVGEVRATQ